MTECISRCVPPDLWRVRRAFWQVPAIHRAESAEDVVPGVRTRAASSPLFGLGKARRCRAGTGADVYRQEHACFHLPIRARVRVAAFQRSPTQTTSAPTPIPFCAFCVFCGSPGSGAGSTCVDTTFRRLVLRAAERVSAGRAATSAGEIPRSVPRPLHAPRDRSPSLLSPRPTRFPLRARRSL